MQNYESIEAVESAIPDAVAHAAMEDVVAEPSATKGATRSICPQPGATTTTKGTARRRRAASVTEVRAKAATASAASS